MSTKIISASELIDFVAQIFVGAGETDATARFVATSLVSSNLAGHDSHGVVRTPQYVALMQKGGLIAQAEPTIEKETAVITQVNGNHSFGQVTAHFAMTHAIRKAQKEGLSVAGLYNCNHVGRLGEWVTMAADENLIGLGFCNGGSRGGLVTPYGGAARRLGTNPIAAAIPVAGKPPVVVDFATSALAEGKVRVARNQGKTMPPGVIQTGDGQPSIQPDDLYNGGMLLPAAGYKGYGLGLIMELLGGVLTGVGCGSFEEFAHGNGVLFIVLTADMFRPLEAFLGDSERLVDIMKGTPTVDGVDAVLVPGEPERRMAEARYAEGIPLDGNTWAQLEACMAGLIAQT